MVLNPPAGPLPEPGRVSRESSCRRALERFWRDLAAWFAVVRGADVSREPVVGKGLQELALWSLEVTPSSQEGRRNPGVQTLVLLRDVKLRFVMFKKI